MRSFFCLFFVAILTSLHQQAWAAEFFSGYQPIEESIFQQQPKVPRYRAFLPVSVDLSKNFPKPGTQGNGSCTGWAVGYAARSYYVSIIENRDIKKSENVPSPTYIYNAIRDPKDCNGGSPILNALALLSKGSLSLKQFPANAGCRLPSVEDKQKATDFKIKRWLAVDPRQLDDIKGQLALGNPVIIGADIGAGFERLKGNRVYRSEPKTVGGHAMTAVGYDDARQAFKVINSWGTQWGDKGFGWISYNTFRKDTREAYVIEVEKPEKKEPEPNIETPSAVIVKPKPKKPDKKIVEDIPQPIDRPVANSDCSYVYSDTEGSRKRMKGFVGTEQDRLALQKQWANYVQDFDIEVRPWPQCEVLLTLASVLGQKGGPKLATQGAKTRFFEGENMVFRLTTPTTPSYVYVAYVQADGSVVTLMQPPSDLSPERRNQTVLFGEGKDGGPRFRATKPFGTEMVLAVASESPLFDGLLPKQQTEREFLSALRRAIIYKADQSKKDRRISAAFLGIETEVKK